MRTIEATVLNRFEFRQTDLISPGAIRKCTTTLYLDQQNVSWKMKLLSHELQSVTLSFFQKTCGPFFWPLERPFAANKLKVQPSDTIGARSPRPHYREHFRAVLIAA